MSNLEDEFLKLIETEFDKPNSNSILLSVRSGSGRVLFEATAGEGEIDSPYFVASISKMFTATVIMQLVEEGCLSLDDTIDEYLPHLRLEGIHVFRGTDYSHQLKVYQLLHQTSGLADYFAKGLDEDFKKNQDRLYSVEDVLDLAVGQPLAPAGS